MAQLDRMGSHMTIRWLMVLLASVVGTIAFVPAPAEAHGPSYRGGVVHGRPAIAPVRHGGHWRPRVGVYIGAPIVAAPFWYHGYYGPSYYYSPPAYYSAPQYAPEYIERDAPAPQSQQNWWYYCNDSQGYYPYVKECPGGWQRVAPQPPAQQ